MVKRKIGYLGGTFDPIHFGHINLAIEAIERLGLSEVWFCPTSISPHKTHSPPHSPEHRLTMTELALKEYSKFKVIQNEAFLDRPARTYETLKALQNEPENSKVELTLILSEDLIANLGSWFNIEKLLEEFPLFIGTRKCSSGLIKSTLGEEWQLFVKKRLFPIRLLEISSEEIRQRLKNKLYCEHLCPVKVLDYIYENGLY